MQINKIGFILPFLRTKFKPKRFFPLAVNWSLTRRCNLRCKYCDEWSYPCNELKTVEIFQIMDELKQYGTRLIGFDGGEPLIRDDISSIVEYAKKNNFFVSINTNGLLVEKKIKGIEKADLINVSFDGPQEIHDYLRGEDSYEAVMNAISILKKKKIAFKLNCTLTKFNLPYLDYIIEIALKMKTRIRFEPVSDAHLKNKEDTLYSMLPSQKDYNEAMIKIMKFKKTNKNIMHSFASLRYLRDWPNTKEMNCFAGKFLCRIEPNGDLYPCVIMRTLKPRNCLLLGLCKAFEMLDKINCKRCWCAGTLEFNCLLSANLRTLSQEFF